MPISFRGYELICITSKLQVILRGVYFGLFPGFRFQVFQPMTLWLLRLIGEYVFVLATPTGRSILATPTGRSIQKINLTYNTKTYNRSDDNLFYRLTISILQFSIIV